MERLRKGVLTSVVKGCIFGSWIPTISRPLPPLFRYLLWPPWILSNPGPYLGSAGLSGAPSSSTPWPSRTGSAEVDLWTGMKHEPVEGPDLLALSGPPPRVRPWATLPVWSSWIWQRYLSLGTSSRAPGPPASPRVVRTSQDVQGGGRLALRPSLIGHVDWEGGGGGGWFTHWTCCSSP